MRKWISIVFLLLYANSITELHELWKVPVLFQHFTEHRLENPQLTVWEFFSLHYLSGDLRDADYERDTQLPFKSHSTISYIWVVALLPSVPSPVPIVSAGAVWVQHLRRPHCRIFVSNPHLTAIWQPPQQIISFMLTAYFV